MQKPTNTSKVSSANYCKAVVTRVLWPQPCSVKGRESLTNTITPITIITIKNNGKSFPPKGKKIANRYIKLLQVSIPYGKIKFFSSSLTKQKRPHSFCNPLSHNITKINIFNVTNLWRNFTFKIWLYLCGRYSWKINVARHSNCNKDSQESF